MRGLQQNLMDGGFGDPSHGDSHATLRRQSALFESGVSARNRHPRTNVQNGHFPSDDCWAASATVRLESATTPPEMARKTTFWQIWQEWTLGVLNKMLDCWLSISETLKTKLGLVSTLDVGRLMCGWSETKCAAFLAIPRHSPSVRDTVSYCVCKIDNYCHIEPWTEGLIFKIRLYQERGLCGVSDTR